MGYYSVNKGEIERIMNGDERKLVAKVYCCEVDRWFEKEFKFEEMRRALSWIMKKMNQLSM